MRSIQIRLNYGPKFIYGVLLLLSLARKPLLFNGPVFGEGYNTIFPFGRGTSKHLHSKVLLRLRRGPFLQFFPI